eukprot:CAMPEP_0119104140 /NCGR_PEP_ID=MMETSP1180-20130426/2433_1 /TAXON_ID=3052 ORGANISM="Chlamydomonas cf sp, Strain CCMP681" /NCGR_SAMPLE_ID=MMETSP1180 /ASSEMBLY_ACC=CAM_ASM_000741 /LENGTH=607 /DNA_ID=CAMNT_0007088821 /DNA_START=147 /DNA_END=1970 /DNA_ORIENTATION=+
MNAEEQMLAVEKARLDEQDALLVLQKARMDEKEARLEKLSTDDPERATDKTMLALQWQALAADKQALAADKQTLATRWQVLERTRALAVQRQRDAQVQGLLVADVLASHLQWLNVASATESSPNSEQIRLQQDPVLFPWDYPDGDVMESLAVLNGQRLRPGLDPTPQVSDDPFHPFMNEAECNLNFAQGVLEVCQAVLVSTGRFITFHPQLREVNNCIPDFTWALVPREAQAFAQLRQQSGRTDFLLGCSFMFVEGKVTSVLPLHDDIVAAAQAGHSGARAALKQIFFYMAGNHHKYGLITDYLRTWACRQDGDGNLHVTQAYLCKSPPTAQHHEGQAPHGQGISVAQLMMSLILKSLSEPRPGPVPAKWPASAASIATQIQQPQPMMLADGGTARSGGDSANGVGGSTAGGSRRHQMLSTCLTIMEPLGEGLSGIVKKARLDDRLVALKVADVFNAQGSVRMLKHEAAVYDALFSLQCVAIPELVGCGYVFDGMAFALATSLVLGSHPRTGQRINQSELGKAIRALDMIHAAGYLHGDIRRENIIVEESSGQVFFIDLGFSCSKEQCMGDFEAECEVETAELHSIFLRRSADSNDSQQTMGELIGD